MNRLFDRDSIRTRPLAERANKLDIGRDLVDPGSYMVSLSPEAEEDVALAAAEIRAARARGSRTACPSSSSACSRAAS
jgi:hypothetical protein